MRNKRLFMTLAALVTAGAVSSLAAQEVIVPTYRGDATVVGIPSKIVALDIAAVDTLDALGVELGGVPDKLYVDYLEDVAAKAQSVGTLFEPNFEAIALMGPDLIVAGGRSSDQYEPLLDIAPTIDMTIWGDDHVAQSLQRLKSFGEITGKTAEAAAVKAAFDAKLATAQAAVTGKGSALIVLTNGPKISVYGEGSRFGWLHSAVGLPENVQNVDAQTHGEAISFEFIAEANPDWLIVIDRAAAIGQDNQSAKATLDNALVAQTTAWSKGQVIYLKSANVYVAGGGIQSMMYTLDDLIAGFGPGA
ncbi:putative ABC transporter solute-binding protein YclQ precursor [Tritonibacter multivorans]|uniref:Putative ABC transporter solute-binding protein YclQ n=2 Tax=Tritonibacter multivorans TaxID=928856 RepID=A0A0P1GGM0_9RHOB|nr:siderophore ABC transporter substrate-binding protein [Tritonibacter multivorans]MDA7422490.1 siderophore ABC transporter substrate-binding protein [Tritonibacter multivorans]CUH74840.1 putative ABC transporter solute-binding protein YclQ precursor [Tritonibacter multivorans]SFD42428.1 iron complex transport system substrate-binding protein [Tritonibacter multivorans]